MPRNPERATAVWNARRRVPWLQTSTVRNGTAPVPYACGHTRRERPPARSVVTDLHRTERDSARSLRMRRPPYGTPAVAFRGYRPPPCGTGQRPFPTHAAVPAGNARRRIPSRPQRKMGGDTLVPAHSGSRLQSPGSCLLSPTPPPRPWPRPSTRPTVGRSRWSASLGSAPRTYTPRRRP